MLTASVIIGLILFLLAALYRREWGIYLIILGLPSYQIRFQIFDIPATFLEAMILILAVALSLRAILINGEAISLKNRLLHFVRNDKLTLLFILLFLLAAGISVFMAPDATKAAGIFKAYFFEAVLFYFLVRLIIDSPGKLEKLFQALALLVLYLSIFGLYQFLTLARLPASWWEIEITGRRIISLLNHPNALALLIGPLLAMLAFLPKNKLNYAALIFGLPAFYLTLSRAGWLALVVTLGVTFLFLSPGEGRGPSYSTGERLRIMVKPLIVLVVAMVLLFAVPYSRTKLLNLTSGHDPTQENRYLLWGAGLDLIKKYPLAGTGLMGFRENFKNYPVGPDKVVQNYPHNFFLNFWVETGLLGLLSMIGLLMLFAKKIYKMVSSPLRGEDKGGGGKNYALAFAAAMAMIVMHSLVDVSYFKNDLAVLFWLIYTLPFIASV